MTHSISHKLILELNGSELALITVKKDGIVANIDFHSFFDNQILEQILDKLPEIYSDITVIIRRKPFITIPETYYTSDLNELFKLSYELPELDKIYLDKTESGIGIGYVMDPNIQTLIASKFTRATFTHEASVILKKLYKEVNFKHPRILISIHDGTLILFAINNTELVLCNYYQAKTNDDVFYFVMLVAEQLHFLPSETELIILGEPKNRNEIFDLFKNYIKDINIWVENYRMSDEIKHADLLSHSFALQALVCE